MTKRNAANVIDPGVPSFGDPTPPQNAISPSELPETALGDEETPSEAVAESDSRSIKTVRVILDLPISVLSEGEYVPKHVDLSLDRRHGVVIGWLAQALAMRGDRLQSGREVGNKADAMRWLLEQIGAQLNG